MRTVVMFLFVWGCVGYSLGTSVLLGPVRWVSQRLRDAGVAESSEKLVVGGIIVVYVVTSFLIALLLLRVMQRTPKVHARIGIASLVLLSALGALWLFMTPAALGLDRGEETQVGSSFTFGPYPDAARLAKLKESGYTAVISLLHPAVVPFEPKLLADERKATEEIGIELLHLPMLPWVGDNAESLDRLEALARDTSARYYVHCYLGRDRVRLARTIVERSMSDASVEHVGLEHRQDTTALMTDGHVMERGLVYRLQEGVFLTPYPTDEEFASWVVNGPWAAVVSLLDPAVADNVPWIEKEARILERYRIRFEQSPLSATHIDPVDVLEATRRIRRLPRPLMIHAFLSPSTGRSPAAEAFLQAWHSDLPPVPPSGFKDGLVKGPVKPLAPNILTGPRPEGREFWTLRRGGIRQVVYLGDEADEAAVADKAAAAGAPLQFRVQDPGSDDWMQALAFGGPWYLYGPGLRSFDARLADHFGPAIPHETREHLLALEPDVESEPAPAAAVAVSEPAPVVEAESPPIIAGPFGWLAPFLPTMRQVILMGPWMLFAAALAGWYAGRLRTRRQIRTQYTRKIFHFIIFSTAAVLQLVAGLPVVVLFSSIVASMVLYAVWRGDDFPFYEAMARPTDAPRRSLFVLIPLATTAIGGVLANLLFGIFAPVGYLVGGWGDAAGEPVGTRWGRRRYTVPSLFGVPATRTLEGSTAVFLVGTAAAFVALAAAGFDPATAAGVAFACGLLGAGVEAVSHHGLDNLTIQLAAAGTAFVLLG